MHGLGGCWVPRALASRCSPLLLPNLLCWMHILSLDEFSSDEELVSVHISFCDYNFKFYVLCSLYLLRMKTFYFLYEFNKFQLAKLDSGGSKKNMHPYLHLFYLRYLYACISFKTTQRNISLM